MDSKNKITVAFFLPSLEPGGTEKNVVNLVNGIDKDTYQVFLVLGKKKGEFLQQVSLDVFVISLNASGSLGLFLALVKYFYREKPDIFVSAFTRINLISILSRFFSGRGNNIKIVATEHAMFSLLANITRSTVHKIFAIFFLRPIGKILYPKADSVICVSEGMAKDFIKNVGCKEKVTVVYNPVTNDDMIKKSEESDFEKEITDIKAPIVLAVGRLVECKNYPGLFKAFALVLATTPSYLVILGRGPEEQALKHLARKMDLSEHVLFMGFKQNPYKYMKKASIFVLSSLQEGFGNVIVEAMAVGCPVVATDCPTGPGEIITHMKNGMLVKVDDEKDLARAIATILKDSVLSSRLSQEGIKRAGDFSVKKSIQEYERIFQSIVR